MLSGLVHPTTVRFARDGRIFVSEQAGEVVEYDGFSDHTPTLVADLRTQVYDNGERGLLGMALDPDFPARPYIYLLYSYDAPPGGTAPTYGTPGTSGDPCPVEETAGYCLSSGRITRLEVSRSSHLTGEKVLLDGWCGEFDSHSVGTLAFDAKRRLYAGAGDGANFNIDPDYGQLGSPPNPCGDPGGADPTIPTAQGGSLRAQDLYLGHDPVGLDGSIIRINPRTGAGATANPLANSSDPNARRIIAYGFRNPFRFTVDPRTQRLWVGDVGWGRSEEIDHVNPDDLHDYGWPCYEGKAVQGHWASLGLDACKRLYESHDREAPRVHLRPRGGGRARRRLLTQLRLGALRCRGPDRPLVLQALPPRALLRGRRPRLHLGDAGRRGRQAESPPRRRLRNRRRQPGRPRVRAPRRALLREHLRGQRRADQRSGFAPVRRLTPRSASASAIRRRRPKK